MRADQLRKLVDRRPFEPIRLHISSGRTADIRHPEMALVTRSLVVVGGAEFGERVADCAVHCNLLHIVRIEPLNGNKKTTLRNTKRK